MANMANMMKQTLSFTLLVAFVAFVCGAPAPAHASKRTLVIVDDASVSSSHSLFLAGLEGRGHGLTFKDAKASDISFEEFGERLFDNVVLFAPAVDVLDFRTLVKFVDDGGNVLVAVDEDLEDSSPLRDFASECGVEFDAAGSRVMDHLQYDASDAEHSKIVTTNTVSSSRMVGSPASQKPILFKGIGQAVDPDNVLAIATLKGSPTSYSAFPDRPISSYPQSAGDQVLLVTSVQGRNNARITFVGSMWMLSDEAFAASIQPSGSSDAAKLAGPSGNEYFADQIGKWTFQEQGVLRTSNIRHQRADGSAPDPQLPAKERPNLPVSMYPDPEIAPNSLVYRIKDDIEYRVDVEELVDGKWVPFKADDMQLEFVMLDAYVRQTMTHDNSGTFLAEFKAPDVYGVFKFRVMYRRMGLSVIDLSTQVSVRPFRHNEYERFIVSAFPYYTSAFSMMIGFFVFGFYFLYSKH